MKRPRQRVRENAVGKMTKTRDGPQKGVSFVDGGVVCGRSGCAFGTRYFLNSPNWPAEIVINVIKIKLYFYTNENIVMLLVVEAIYACNMNLLFFTAFCSNKKTQTTIYKQKYTRAFCICSFFTTFVFYELFVSTGKVNGYIYYVLVFIKISFCH